ncbi:uncharacterized protein LOC129581040 isoform X4 [Paramacrobiotus metropolitanus]|uniref:uncharacterized protein LOC129581040 isoform X4 n=1 Tax=Paramacrobiotus metropolitanus TaxID=2943436 RepID=UPI0024457359|nr:uncharacterized protein LOC129581040 isoform X4 [Paramacrobiotus metropolitanus]
MRVQLPLFAQPSSVHGAILQSLASNCWDRGCLTSLVDLTDFLDPGWILLDGLALPVLQLCACGALNKARHPVPGEKVDPLGFGGLLSLFLFSILYMSATLIFSMWMGNWDLHKVALLIFLVTGVMTITTAVLGTMRRSEYEKTSGSRALIIEGAAQNFTSPEFNLVVHSARMV